MDQTIEPERDEDVGERAQHWLSDVGDPTLKEALEKTEAHSHGMNVMDYLLNHKGYMK